MMTKQHVLVSDLTESLDLINGIQKVILDAENDITDHIEELDTNVEDLVSEIFRPDFGRYTCRIQGPGMLPTNRAVSTLIQSK